MWEPLLCKSVALSGSHYAVQECGGEMAEKEMWNDLCTMKKGRTGDVREERNSLM